MQGEWERAGVTAQRFAINTTIGLVGLFDVAKEWDLPPHSEDFGQTLAVWGVPEGPYLVIPILGPSNPRDAVGTVADSYLDPINFALRLDDPHTDVPFGRSAATGVDLRSRNIETLDDLRRGSLDWYATVRSLYRQRRNAEIQNSTTTSPPPGLVSQSPWADEPAVDDQPKDQQ
jgi:phospholipid-binding lipoprotein MlaA